jgi:hypothetical protein
VAFTYCATLKEARITGLLRIRNSPGIVVANIKQIAGTGPNSMTAATNGRMTSDELPPEEATLYEKAEDSERSPRKVRARTPTIAVWGNSKRTDQSTATSTPKATTTVIPT